MKDNYVEVKGPAYKNYVQPEDYVATYSMFDINGDALPPVDIMIFDYDDEQIVAIRFGPNPKDDVEIGNIYEALSDTDSEEVEIAAWLILKKGEVRWRRRGE